MSYTEATPALEETHVGSTDRLTSKDYERYITEQLIPKDFTELAQTSLPDIQEIKSIVDQGAGGL